MPHTFDDAALAGVLGHMNDDHTDDNLLIARAFSPLPDVISSTMTTFDGAAGQWHVITADGAEDVIRVPWPGGEITERREVRREIVALYDAACARLGVEPGGQQSRQQMLDDGMRLSHSSRHPFPERKRFDTPPFHQRKPSTRPVRPLPAAL